METSRVNFERLDYDPFSEQKIDKVVDLLDSQKEIWISCVLGGEKANLANNLSVSIELVGDLNTETLYGALEGLIHRHEVFRMTFSPDGKKCIIYDTFPLAYSFQDNSGFPSEEGKVKLLQEAIYEESITPFDLEKGPLIRFRLQKLNAQSHMLIITGHHIIVDGWSLDLVTKEIGQIYTYLLEEKYDSLPDPVSFSKYVLEMALYNQSPDYTKTEQYWINLYEGNSFYLDLPTDKQRPINRTYESQRLDLNLDTGLLEAVRKTAIRAKTSLFNTLMAVFEIYFHKLTGQRQLSLGIPVSGQAVSENFSLVGHCVHLLPVPCKIDSSLSFKAFLQKRKSELLENYDHSKYTFSKLLQHLRLPRENSKIPLIPIIINFESAKNDRYNYKDLEIVSSFNPKKYETFENALYLTEHKDSLLINWQFNSNLYNPDSIQRMMEEYRELLKFLSEKPESIIGQIDIVENAFLKEIKPWNNTHIDFPPKNAFTQLIGDAADRNPKKTAVSCDGHQISYEELEFKSNQLANYLISCGVKKGEIIGLCVDRSLEMVVTLLGIVKSGGVYLPLDPVYPKERIEMMVDDASCRYFLVSKRHKNQFQTSAPTLNVEDIFVDLVNYPTDYPQVVLEGDDLAYVIYTSGSTGKPKGVKVAHQNLLNFLLSMQMNPGISRQDKLLAVTTISFDIAALELYLPLISGAEVVIADSETARDARLLIRLIDEQKISMMQATPATWRMMVNSSWKKGASLKILCGGEALPQDLAQSLLAYSESLWNMYGPTETTVWSLVKKIESHEDPITIGSPIHNTQVYIVDENGNLLPPGTIGEIWIGGQGVAKGYLNRPDLTSEKFVLNDFEPEKGKYLYRTGDLGKFLPSGELTCMGRLDNQIKIRGYRIELGEIENKINQIPEISESMVIAREDRPGDIKLVAYVTEHISDKNGTPSNGVSVKVDNSLQDEHVTPQSALLLTAGETANWKDFLKLTLPDYMIPQVWVSLKEFPKTNNNKVDRKSLPQPLRGEYESQESQDQLQSKEEKLVAGIWSELLRIHPVGMQDNFFELGGHSLLAVEVMTALEKETGLNLPLNTIFEKPTVSEFASILGNSERNGPSWSSLVPVKPEGNKIPLYLIHGAGANVSPFYGLAKTLDKNQPVYGLQAKGLNGIDKPLCTIKEMASFYIEEIVRHDPKGPYYLGGQSFGAYVAFEMARQMKAKNLDIQKVILLDVTAYQGDKELSFWEKKRRELASEFQKRAVEIELLLTAPDTLKRLKGHSFYRKKRKIQKFFGLDYKVEDATLFHTIEKIRNINHKAMDDYILKPYDGDVFLFKAKIKTFFVSDLEYYGWKQYAKNMHVVETEGDHNSMFEDEKLVKVLGRKIQDVLDS